MSYCDCDYTSPSFYDCSNRKARKAHVCDECFSSIQPGETYESVAGMWEGDFQTYKTCSLCLELRQWAKISVPCFCHSYTELHEAVTEMVRDIRRDVPGIVFECGRRIVAIERRKYRDHWPRRLHNQHRAALIAAGNKPWDAERATREMMRSRALSTSDRVEQKS